MFTGLIAELGVVDSLKRQGESYRITIRASKVMENLRIGDSVAVDGVCLTVVDKDRNGFTADMMPETARLTINGSFKSGDKVNLERTLRLCDGLDGHIVMGHVEGTGTIVSCVPDGIASVVTIKPKKPELLKYILSKGSIAIDGISLTVTKVTQDSFSVSLIPHTSKETTLGFKGVGDEVNLETDIIGKYVERLLLFGSEDKKEAALDWNTLAENGFL